MISRRELFMSAIAASFADAAMAQSKSPKKMTLSIHQNTSRAAGYRKSLEGWAKAGIKFVEITDVLLDEFLKSDTLAAAKRVFTDLGLTPVSSAAGSGIRRISAAKSVNQRVSLSLSSIGPPISSGSPRSGLRSSCSTATFTASPRALAAGVARIRFARSE